MSYGIKMMLLAGFAFAVMNVFVKLIPGIPALEIAFFRAAISLVMISAAIKRSKVPFWGNNKPVLWLRGIFGSIGLIFFFYTIKQMPLASATVIHYSSPVFTSLIAMFVLGERLKWFQVVFFVVSISGIMIIYGLDHRVDSIGLLMGLAAAIGSGAAYNCIRKLQLTENPHVIMLYFPLVVLPVSGLVLILQGGWIWPSGIEWFYLLMIGLLTQIAQFGITVAYQHEKATRIAPISYAGLIYALLFGFVFFGEVFNIEILMGMLLVVLGVILSIWIKPGNRI
jgi:drug/metabolite transporter (DMT)-like permease